MFPRQCAQLGWQGECQQEILGRYLFLQLPLQPLLAFVVLTVRTVAMSARVRHEDLVFALGTFGQHQGTAGSAAVVHGVQGTEVRRKNRALILFEKLRHEGIDD